MQEKGTGHSEKGAALILAIVSLLIITGLATAMLTSGRTDALIARNEERSVHARMAAEAGLNHAVQVVSAYLVNWKSVPFASATAAVTDVINGPDDSSSGDDGSLTEYGLAAPTVKTNLDATAGTSYSVRVYDDDDTATARKITLSSDDITVRMEENNNIATDLNERLAVQAIGYGPGGTTTTLEAIVGPLMFPAVVTNSNLTIDGSVNIEGDYGGVHTNSNLIMNGGSPYIEQNCTSTGTFTGDVTNCDGNAGGGNPTITIPNVWAADYIAQANFILNDDGSIQRRVLLTDPLTTVCTTNACAATYGWEFISAADGWRITGNPTFGAYYVEGNVTSSGSPGSGGTPIEISMFLEGYLDISGSPDLKPYLPELFIVTNKDLKINGNIDTHVEGRVLVREQLSISGSTEFYGQLLVQDASSTCTLVTNNTISGSVHIEYNGLVGASNFAVLAWREVR